MGEAIARIGTDIVRLKTPGPLRIPKRHFKDTIIKRSRSLYYRPIGVVRDLIRQKDRRWERPYSLLTDTPGEDSKEFIYDEF